MSSSPPIKLAGFASGLDVNSLITALIQAESKPLTDLQTKKTLLTQQKAYMDNTRDRVGSLLSSIKKITASSVLNTNLFDSKKATISDDKVVGATVGSTAAAQSLQVEVVKLATATKASSQSNVGQILSGASAVSAVTQGNVSSGNFTVFVNGVANTIAVNKATDTVDDVLGRISAIGGITGASVDGAGKLNITFGAGTAVQLGASGDTSNFLDLTALKTGVATATSIQSSVGLSTINTQVNVETAAANLQTAVTAGSQFTIGSATFSTAGKSLASIITEINNSTTANVTAVFNTTTNKLELTSKNPGNTLITLADTSGNFLSAVGLIVGGDSTASQTAGQNAEFKLNGNTLYSPTNTVSESISGITGVTLDLKKEAVGSPVTINIGRDSSELKDAIKDFVTKFNNVISYVDQLTNAQNKGPLADQSTLKRFRNDIRQTVSGRVASLTQFNSLQLAGISTGAAGTGGAQASSVLQLDESKLDAALASNPDEVKQLFSGTSGIFTQLEAITAQATSATQDGLFTAYTAKQSATIKQINDQIDKTQARLDKRETFLRKQFSLADQLISQYNSQSSAISGLSARLAAQNN